MGDKKLDKITENLQNFFKAIVDFIANIKKFFDDFGLLGGKEEEATETE